MSLNLRYPNITGLSEKEQLAQIKSYLHQLVEQLNYATIDSGDGASQSASSQSDDISYSELRAFVIQELQEIENSVDRLSTKMQLEYVSDEELPEAIEDALAQAKESGEFDGQQGPQGPQGIQGPAGQKGADGFSPVVEVTDIEGGHRVTITDSTATNSFDVLDGKTSTPEIDYKEASGSCITINDATNTKLNGLAIYGKTTQNGTPTPESPVALESVGADGSVSVTVAAKNLWDEETVSGYWQSSDGKFVSVTNQLASKNMIPIPSEVYFVAPAGVIELRFYDRNKKYISGKTVYAATGTVEPPANACYLHINLKTAYGTVYKNDVCISAVSTAYEPHKPIQTLTAATPNGLHCVGQNGEYRDYIDFKKGVYVQCVYEYTFNGTETVAAPYWSSTGFSFYAGNYGHPKPWSGSNTVWANCNYLSGSNAVAANGIVYFRNVGSFSTQAEAKAWLKEKYDSGTPLVVQYAIDTPIETPLSAEEMAAYRGLHTYKTITTVFNDANAYMELEYPTSSGISVTESGIDSGWSYKKWSNGTYEMFGEFTVTTTTICTDMGSMFCSEEFPLPTPFAIDHAIVSGSADDLFLVASGGRASVDADTHIGFVLLRPFSFDANMEIIVRLHVTGTYH